MTRARGYIRAEVELAAALLQIPVLHSDGSWGPIVSFHEAKQMTPAQIRSLWQRHHYPIPHEDDGPDEHWNLLWRPIMPHREDTKAGRKTAKKSSRVRARVTAHQRKLIAKAGRQLSQLRETAEALVVATTTEPKQKRSRWGSRKMRGGRDDEWKKPLRGNAVRRARKAGAAKR